LHDATLKRACGELLAERPKHPGTRGQLVIRDDSGGKVTRPPESDIPTLQDSGLSKYKSSTWQKVVEAWKLFYGCRYLSLRPEQFATTNRRNNCGTFRNFKALLQLSNVRLFPGRAYRCNNCATLRDFKLRHIGFWRSSYFTARNITALELAARARMLRPLNQKLAATIPERSGISRRYHNPRTFEDFEFAQYCRIAPSRCLWCTRTQRRRSACIIPEERDLSLFDVPGRSGRPDAGPASPHPTNRALQLRRPEG